MLKTFSLLIFLSFPLFLFSQQNLVLNPSFEDIIKCPSGLGDFTVVNWYSPTLGTPDLFHTCNINEVGIPQNGFGWQYARTGNAYSGVLTSDFSANEYREYIQCELISTLESGKLYEISFYVSRTDSSKKACDNIGAYLSSTPVSATNADNLPYSPQIVSEQNKPITDNTNWIQIVDTITAVGGERYLTIGVFTNNQNTNWIYVNGGWEDEAHYYIDDVSVKQVFLNSISKYSKSHILLFPNPSNGLLYLSSNEAIENFTIHTSLGELLINQYPRVEKLQLDLSLFPNGLYYVSVKTSKSSIQKKIIINH